MHHSDDGAVSGYASGRGLRAGFPSMWRLREKALSDTLMTWPLAQARGHWSRALDRDVGLTLYVKGLGVSSLRVQRHLGRSVVVVPYQTGYPISFVALLETSSEFRPKTHAAA